MPNGVPNWPLLKDGFKGEFCRLEIDMAVLQSGLKVTKGVVVEGT